MEERDLAGPPGFQAGPHKGSRERTRDKLMLSEKLLGLDVQHRHLGQFHCQEAVRSLDACRQLHRLCRQWLNPERHTKGQILEPFLPLEMESWMWKHGVESTSQEVALAEGFLLTQVEEDKKQEEEQHVRNFILKKY